MQGNLPAEATILIEETTDSEIIAHLAHATWPVAYGEILVTDQIEYMLDNIYSPTALQQQMDEGQTFLVLMSNDQPVAFAAYSLYLPEEQIFKLNKLYIHPEHQGKGYGQLLMDEVVKRTSSLGGTALELNVHRSNPAQFFYKKNGFVIHQTLDIPFGPYVLNDYIMRKPLG